MKNTEKFKQNYLFNQHAVPDNHQIVQQMFCKIRLKDYFEYLRNEVILGAEAEVRKEYPAIKRYTNLNENYIYDFADWANTDYNDDITVGEMLTAAWNMLDNNPHKYENVFQKEAIATGIKIINVILIKPLIAAEKYYKALEEHMKRKGE